MAAIKARGGNVNHNRLARLIKSPRSLGGVQWDRQCHGSMSGFPVFLSDRVCQVADPLDANGDLVAFFYLTYSGRSAGRDDVSG